jgi:hypothetical protein
MSELRAPEPARGLRSTRNGGHASAQAPWHRGRLVRSRVKRWSARPRPSKMTRPNYTERPRGGCRATDDRAERPRVEANHGPRASVARGHYAAVTTDGSSSLRSSGRAQRRPAVTRVPDTQGPRAARAIRPGGVASRTTEADVTAMSTAWLPFLASLVPAPATTDGVPTPAQPRTR